MYRVLYSHQYYYEGGASPDARIVLPSKVCEHMSLAEIHRTMTLLQTEFRHVWQMIDALGLEFPGKPIEYIASKGKRCEQSNQHAHM